jgi:hypothetical protein
MTTHGDRFRRVHLVIALIALGKMRPHRLILWLDNPAHHDALTRPLSKLQQRGLEIYLCENFGPHTKYWPYVSGLDDTVENDLVTADDDVVYPSWWLERLVTAARANRSVISAHRAHRISLRGDALAPYLEWLPVTSTEPSHLNFATGVSGVLYPPRFQALLRKEGEAFKQRSASADDVWINAVAAKHGWRVRQVDQRSRLFPNLWGSQSTNLFRQNVLNLGNDAQLAACYTAPIIESLRNE